MSQSGALWSDSKPVGANTFDYYQRLSGDLKKLGVVPSVPASESLRVRIDRAGQIGLSKLRYLRRPELQTPAAARRFGWGYVITEFLVAPAYLPDAQLAAVCSLGALSNLMIVTCDNLLDTGVPVHEVLPDHQRETGGDASAVMLLLRHYWQVVDRLGPSDDSRRTIKEVIANMFDAEARTVTFSKDLPFRYWLRKCSLPLVLMALPALPAGNPQRYLLWIHRVGRFLGIVDDAVDYENDVLHDQPNYFLSLAEPDRLTLIHKAATWGFNCLREWDALVTSSRQTILAREAFLQTIWGW